MNTEKFMLENSDVQNTTINEADAFQYLKSLPRNEHKVKSKIVAGDIAQSFTDAFRITGDIFTIPVSWSLTKDALISLLGITNYDGFAAITGVRFYAGLNDDRQLTLIAVSTEADPNDGTINNDLTEADQYPYYDYADPCPSHCSNVGNLRILNKYPVNMNFQRVGK